MSLAKNPGRVAGLLYLPTVLLAPFTLIYIPSTLFVHGNATATADNIAAHEALFSLGIVIDLFSGILWILIVLALYRLLKGVNQNLAVLMAVLGGVMVTLINFLITLNNAAVLVLVRDADFLSAFDKPERDALVMLFLRITSPRGPGRRNLLGAVALPAGDPRVPVALSAALPGRLAGVQRPRLPGHELDRLPLAATRTNDREHHRPRLVRRTGADAVAGHKRRGSADLGASGTAPRVTAAGG